MKKIVFLLLVLFSMAEAKADSPLTSTAFYVPYQNAESVKHALENGLDEKTLEFLASKKGSSVEKLAAINALSWGTESNVAAFEAYLLQKRKGLKAEVFEYLRNGNAETPETRQTEILTADDLMCWAYMQAMGNYFEPRLALAGAKLASARKPESMSHAVCHNLILSQIDFDISWCRVFLDCHEMIVQTSYDENLLSAAAVEEIMSYIRLYESECNGSH